MGDGLTQPQRQARRLAVLRTERGRLKRQIAAGELSPWPLLEGNDRFNEPYIITLRVLKVLEWIPGVGEITAYDVLNELCVPAYMKFEGISMAQRKEMSLMLQEVVA
jgi:hypothetical protein